MKLTWTNTEWDNFSGVASQDNLLMLNAGDDFLNAGGGTNGNSKVDSATRIRTYANGVDYDAWYANISAFKITDYEPLARVKGTYTKLVTGKNNLNDFLTELKYFKTKYEDGNTSLYEDLKNYNVTSTGAITKTSNDYNQRRAVNEKIWTIEAKIARLTEIIASVQKLIVEVEAKNKEEAEAKAKAQAEADAKAKMKSLTDQLITAKTPEEKARVQAEIDALAGNVAKATGSSKTIVYVVVGLAIIGGAYMLLRRKA